jgi:hypothetical protein
MAKKKKLQTAPAEGERCAIGGYQPQYVLSAETILRSLRYETLEWIRLADPKAGRLDDFQLGTPARLDAYQVKWSRDGGTISFRDMVAVDGNTPSLIAQLTDGWTRLRAIHPDRRVVVHLQTNQTPSTTRLIPSTSDADKVSFARFLNEVWHPFHNDGRNIPTKWRPAWHQFVRASTLHESKFRDFVADCMLEFQLQLPVANGDDPVFERDLKQLTESLFSAVADPSNIVQLSRGELLRRLGWSTRLSFVSRHEFPDPSIPYHEISTTADRLRLAIRDLSGGYIAVLGDPGSGKSTLLTNSK